MQSAEPEKVRPQRSAEHATTAVGHDKTTAYSGQGALAMPGLAVSKTIVRRSRETADQAKKGEEAPAATVPNATDAKLQNLVKDLYKGVRMNPRIGDGSCADAIRHELANPGAQVGGRGHVTKGREYSQGLTNWMKRNPNASGEDRAAAQQILDDLTAALGGDS